MQKELYIASKNGTECRWTSLLSQGGTTVCIGAIFVKDASRNIIVEWNYSELAIDDESYTLPIKAFFVGGGFCSMWLLFEVASVR